MSATIFTTRQYQPGARCVRESSATLAGGHWLNVSATGCSASVELSVHSGMLQSYMAFTPDQARAVAAELLACADALQGRA
ncbi:MAG: hypothetical protein HUU13_06810 [Burkholderiaceae bacterium]|nr:hypothetical protein [Burkholderiaceae bacterium]